MSRPQRYFEIAQSSEANGRYLAGTSTIYGLTYQGEWLVQVEPKPWLGTTVKKYHKHIYATKGMAQTNAKKIQAKYGIEPEIIEINTDDLELA
jgi:hypothetical protein